MKYCRLKIPPKTILRDIPTFRFKLMLSKIYFRLKQIIYVTVNLET